ncbi:MAG: hypothetical protein WCO92_04405 [Verrucomicrobiota bacterium]
MINKTFIFSSLCFAGFLQYWLWERAHVCSIVSLGSMMLISVVSLLYGALILPLLPLPREISGQRPIQLLLGFFIFNTLLFIVVGAHLLSVKNGFFVFTGIIFLAAPLVSFYKKTTAPTLRFSEQLPGMVCLLFSGIGATLLCCDPLSIPINENGMIYFPMWGDSFFHARLISLFAQADTFHKISNVQLSGVPLPFYHYAAYLMSAAVVSLTQVNAYIIFSCFLMPVGVFLLGLAAFTLTHAFWRGWPAVAATVAVIFLPDAYYQGFQNKFLSCQFHLHVGPASFYGIGCGALSWLLMIQGCRLKKVPLVFGGWFSLGMMVVYKAQLFVANTFVLLLFPCFFFLRCDKWKRIFAAAIGALIFFTVVAFSQRYDCIPIIRFNGGGINKYFKLLSEWTNIGALHSFLLENLWQHPLSFPWYQLLAGTMLYFCTLGLWGIGVIVVVVFLRRKVDLIVWSFPFWIIVNYLVISMGLCMSSRNVGYPEELVNRPLMWAYFAVVTWTAGGFYFLLCGNQLPKTWLGRVVAGFILLGSLMMPLTFAHGLQTMPMWNITLKSNALPVAMVEALDVIKQRSCVGDIVQGSETDPLCVVSGLTERQNYMMSTRNKDWRADPEILAKRVKELESFKQMTTEGELKTFINTHPITWYLLRPETKVAWPDSFKNSAVFQSGGYRVYKLQP